MRGASQERAGIAGPAGRIEAVVQTLANLVHEQGSAGIMVTHDLRMVEYADRVVQMMDGLRQLLLDVGGAPRFAGRCTDRAAPMIRIILQ